MALNPNKRVCIVNTVEFTEGSGDDTQVIKKGDRVMRTTRSFAETVIRETNGGWAYTSKGKLKSFLNKNGKLTRNFNYLERVMALTGDEYPQRRWLGDVVVEVPTFAHQGELIKYKVPIAKKGFKLIKHSAREVFNKLTRKWVLVGETKQVIDVAAGINPIMMEKTIVKEASPLFSKKQKITNTGKKRIILAFAG